MSDPVRVARARLAATLRWQKPPAEVAAARRDLAAAHLSRDIRAALTAEAPLTASQCLDLASMLLMFGGEPRA